jgi:hypothetical protein
MTEVEQSFKDLQNSESPFPPKTLISKTRVLQDQLDNIKSKLLAPTNDVTKRTNYCFGGAMCKTCLAHPRTLAGIEFEYPIKTFVSLDFNDWLAGLLSLAMKTIWTQLGRIQVIIALV